MKKLTILMTFILFVTTGFSQVAINKDGSAPASNSILHVKSSNGSVFFINDSTGKVGIATTSPQSVLQIGSGIKTFNVFEDLSNDNVDNDGDGVTDEAGEGEFRFGVGSNGKVGVNTINPQASLQIGEGINTLNVFEDLSNDGLDNDGDGVTDEAGEGEFRLGVGSSGKVGIHTTTPQASLQIGEGISTFNVFEDLSNDYVDNDGDGVTDEFGEGEFRFGVGSNGKVGINTTNPQATLQIGNGVKALNVYADLSNDGMDNDGDGVTDETGEGEFSFGVGPSGKVGISTADPQATLQIGNGVKALNVYADLSNDNLDNDGDGVTDESGEGEYKFGVGTSYGKVGIGTDTPGQLLDVAGAMHLQPGSAPANPKEGDIYMDAATHKLRCFDGNSWHDLW